MNGHVIGFRYSKVRVTLQNSIKYSGSVRVERPHTPTNEMELELESRNHQLYQFSFSINCTDLHKPRLEASSSVFEMVSGDVYSYFEKGCGKKRAATIPEGNMGYDQYTVPDDCSCRSYLLLSFSTRKHISMAFRANSFKFL